MSLEILTQSQVFTAPITAKDLFVENIQSLSATINVVDVINYEVSGFNVDGELSATSIKATDLYVTNIYGATIGGNSSGYFTTLSADTLGKALDLGSHALTNANIDSGTIDNTTIGSSTAVVGRFTTLTATQAFTVTGSISSSGNLITGNIPSSNTANTVFAAPNGTAGAASFRALVATDIPVLDTSKITTGTLGVNRGGTGQSTFTVGNVLLGDGTNGLNSVAGLTTTLSALSSDNTPMVLVFTNGVLTSITV